MLCASLQTSCFCTKRLSRFFASRVCVAPPSTCTNFNYFSQRYFHSVNRFHSYRPPLVFRSGYQPSTQYRRLQTTPSTPLSSISNSKAISPWVQTKNNILILLRYVWPEGQPQLKQRVVIALLLLLSSKLVGVQVPYLFKLAVDSLSTGEPAIYLGLALSPVTILIGYGAVRSLSSAFTELRSAVFGKVAHSAIRQVSLNVFHHLHELSLRFHLSRQTGAVAKSIDRGARGINFILTAMIFNVLPTLVELGLVSGIVSYTYGPKFAGVVVGTMVAYTAFTFYVTNWRSKFRKQMNQAENDASATVIDSLINYETVKFFNSEEAELKRYDKSLRSFEDAALSTTISLSFLNFGQTAIFSVALSALMVMTANGVENSVFTVGDIVMVNGLLFQLSLPLNFLGSIYREIQQSLQDMESLFSILEVKPDVTTRDNAPNIYIDNNTGGTVEFRNVSFGYSPDRLILDSISFKVEAGQTLAVVGPSGCGKSTLLRLLYRLFDPYSGHILISGQNIHEVSLSSLRRQIGVVPQDTVLFNQSIYNNVSYGKLNATQDEVFNAAKMAHIHDAILGFPKGYETQVGERGLKLSGGEKQRVSIARAVLKNSPILFCDEATSALDSHTEKAILEELRTIAQGRTTIMIAHRLSTVMRADHVIVLDRGHIVERGNHHQLVSKPNGLYSSMWHRQQQGATV